MPPQAQGEHHTNFTPATVVGMYGSVCVYVYM
jgi:hypothetical protein